MILIDKIRSFFSREDRFLLFIASFEFLLGFILYFVYGQYQRIYPDSIFYLRMAENISLGKWYVEDVLLDGGVIFYHPFYSFVISLVHKFINSWELSGVLVSLLFYSFLALPVWYLSKILFHKQAAFIAVVLILSSPIFLFYSNNILAEFIFSFLILFAVFFSYYILFVHNKHSLLFFIAGIISAICFLTKAVGFILFPFTIFWIIINFKKFKNIKKFIFSLLWFIFGFVVILSPYQFLIYQKTGKFMISGSQNVYLRDRYFYIKNVGGKLIDYQKFEQIKKSQKEKLFSKFDYISFIKASLHPTIITLSIKKFLVNILYLFLFYIPFFIVGILGGIKKNIFKRYGPSTIFIISFCSMFIGFYSYVVSGISTSADLRYLIPIIPFFYVLYAPIFSSIFFNQEFKVLRKPFLFLYKYILVGLIILSMITQTIALIYMGEFIWIGTGIKTIDFKIAHWVQKNLSPHSIIMDRWPHITYYSHNQFIRVPEGSYNEIINYARHYNADFLIVSRWWISLRQELEFLFKEKIEKNNDLEKIQSFDFSPDVKGDDVVIYKFINKL